MASSMECYSCRRCWALLLYKFELLFDDECWASKELLNTFHARRQNAFARQLNVLTIFAIGMVVFYVVVSGFGTPLHVFFRINNIMSCIIMVIGARALSFSRSYSSSSRVRGGFDLLALFITLHYMAISLCSYGRSYKLLSYLYNLCDRRLDSSLDPKSEELFAEPYGMLLCLLGVSIVGYLRIVSRRIFCVIAMAPSFLWVLQAAILATDLDLLGSLKIAGTLFGLSMMLSLGHLAAEHDVRQEFLHVNRQRSEIMEIMRGASMPVFFVKKRDDHTSRDLCIEMWNNALVNICDVPEGTILTDIPCLRGAHCEVLAKAVRRALSSRAERTQRMLLRLVAASGNVWLQADVCPVPQLGENCVLVMGSDVTEFVDQHRSLLQHLPEEAPYEENKGTRDDRDIMPVSANLDPAALTLCNCSPQFNVLFQRRMDGQHLLPYIPCAEEQQCVREALQHVTSGLGPKDMSVTFEIRFRCLPKGSGGKAKKPRALGVLTRRYTAWLKLADTDDTNQHLVRVSVASFEPDDRSDSGTMSEPAIPLARSLDFGTDNIDNGGSDAGRCQSDARWERGCRDIEQVSVDSSDDQKVPKSSPVHRRALLAHTIEIMRHLSQDYYESFTAMEHVLHVVGFCKPQSWQGGCVDWQCPSCNALNDDDDEICFICWTSRIAPLQLIAKDLPRSALSL